MPPSGSRPRGRHRTGRGGPRWSGAWRAELPASCGIWYRVATEDDLSRLLYGAGRRPKETPIPGWYLVRDPGYEGIAAGREVWSLAEVRVGLERALPSLPDVPAVSGAGGAGT